MATALYYALGLIPINKKNPGYIPVRSKNCIVIKERRQFVTYYAGCPTGFTDLSSINGGCYQVINDNLNWIWAGRACRSLHKDAHLLVINDAAEQSAVAEWLDAVDGQ